MMIIRAALAVALALGVLADPLAAEAQQAGMMWRIGYLQTPPASTTPIRDAFRQGLRDLGYVEGRNLVIEFRDAGAKPERLAALASELVRLKVDVIVATGTQAISAAKQATSVIPIVMTVSGDAVGTGLVASLARPSGNVTGLTLITPESAGKRLELLKEAFPRTSRVAVLWNPTDPPRLLEYKQTQDAAKLLGLMLQSVEVRSSEELEGAFSAITRGAADALVTFSDPLTAVFRKRIVEFAATSRLPAMYGRREEVEDGGLMSYAPNFADLFRRAATYVDKILKGAKPADLTVEQPTKFELVINLKTAKVLGLTIPPSLLVRADEVIQ